MHRHIYVAFILALTLSGVRAQNDIHYVTPAGAGTEDGSNWENAAPGVELQNVIDAATSGDSIWVSCVIYCPTSWYG